MLSASGIETPNNLNSFFLFHMEHPKRSISKRLFQI
jgi:hypothetical protein